MALTPTYPAPIVQARNLSCSTKAINQSLTCWPNSANQLDLTLTDWVTFSEDTDIETVEFFAAFSRQGHGTRLVVEPTGSPWQVSSVTAPNVVHVAFQGSSKGRLSETLELWWRDPFDIYDCEWVLLGKIRVNYTDQVVQEDYDESSSSESSVSSASSSSVSSDSSSSDQIDLYYLASVDTDWNTLGNWWLDSAGTVPATRLPSNGDTAYVLAGMTRGAPPIVTGGPLAHIYYGDSTHGSFEVDHNDVAGDITVNNGVGVFMTYGGNATFYGGSRSNGNTFSTSRTIHFYDSFNEYDLEGRVEFHGTSENSLAGGIVFGDAYFYDSSINYGSVESASPYNGDCWLYDSSQQLGFVAGTIHDLR